MPKITGAALSLGDSLPPPMLWLLSMLPLVFFTSCGIYVYRHLNTPMRDLACFNFSGGIGNDMTGYYMTAM